MSEVMKVGELREKLEHFDEDVKVFTHGYEGGFNSVRVPDKTREYKLNVEAGNKSYYGNHARVGGFLDGLEGNDEDKEVVEGICL